jgi:hypothetical protein
MHQFPTSFEFTEDLLVFLADHVHSGLFGTFLGNCMKQRMNEYECMDYTQSIWSYIFDNKDKYGMFVNKDYCELKKPIWPSLGMGKVVLWERFHLRWDAEFHPRICSGNSWHDDWGLGKETLADESGAIETKRESEGVIRLRANTCKASEDGYEPEEIDGDAEIPLPLNAGRHHTMATTIEEEEEEEDDEAAHVMSSEAEPQTVDVKAAFEEEAEEQVRAPEAAPVPAPLPAPAPAPVPTAAPAPAPAPAPVNDGVNPDDWEEKFSDKHNRKFWRNRRTGEKTWKNPLKGIDVSNRKSQAFAISNAAQLAAQAAQMKLDA